jgi:hypothetical protein
MAAGQDAVGSEGSPVLVLSYPTELRGQSNTCDHAAKFGLRAQFITKIRESLAIGKMVLIQVCNDGYHVQFNEEEVRSWKGTLAQAVQWQGRNTRMTLL